MLETRIHELTLAVEALTKAIGGMQAPAPTLNELFYKDTTGGAIVKQREAAIIAEESRPNEKSSPTIDTSQTSAEESKPALTYADNVKPITLRLSKEKGRETAIAVLQRFGVKGAQDLDVGQWADYIAHCEKVLAGGEV